MNPEPDPVESLFAAVVAKPAETRAAFLDQACAGDPALRQRVEALLNAHAEAGGQGFLVEANQPSTAAEGTAESTGMRVGPYKLLQQIGEGGMGIVYMAEQEQPVRRRVALKIIKPGMDSAQVIARFEAERQALAMMDHQNIARVLDAGTTPTGRPYFVMELVHGIPITRFCDENQLTPRQRLELFVPVCQAIQHAHQKGIIHRDVKPSNVLVTLYDDKPVPKVIDFGVAKAIEQRLTEKTLFTQFGTLVGTFEYMSPEQAEMNAFGVDTRSDVYSLGVLLYELLTGTTPLESKRLRQAALSEVLRLIREEEPLRPSARLSSSGNLPRIAAARKTEPGRLAFLLRGELDWIVMRCLEKDRSRRYETANGLARDVEHYLRDERVEACPPSAGYRLRKFMRRYRVALTTAAAFALLLITATCVSVWLAMEARQAASIADQKRDDAYHAQQVADMERNRADHEAAQVKASATATRAALDRITVAKGIQLAKEGDLFKAMLYFVKPLERGGLTPEEERIHRMRIACYQRYTPGRQTLRYMFFHDGPVEHAAFSPDAKRLLTVSGKTAYVWDLRNGKRIITLRHPAKVSSAQFSADGQSVLTAAGPMVWTWDAYTGTLRRFPLIHGRMWAAEQSLILPLSPWEALGLIGMKRLQQRSEPGFAFSADGRRALIDSNGVVQVFDVLAGRLLGQWASTYSREGGYEFSPDGALVCVAGYTGGDGYRVYRADRGVLAWEQKGDDKRQFVAASFSPDGRQLLELSDDTARLRDAESGKVIGQTRRFEGWLNWGVFANEPGLLAVAKNDRLWVQNTQTNKPVTSITVALGYFHKRFFFQPDDRQIITLGDDSAVDFWNVYSGSRAAPTLPHMAVNSVAEFSPDAKLFVWGGRDGIARVWIMASGYESRYQPQPLVPHAQARSPAGIDFHIAYAAATPGSGPAMFFMQGQETPEVDTVRTNAHIRSVLNGLAGRTPKNTNLQIAVSPDGRRLFTVLDNQVFPNLGPATGPPALPKAQLWDTSSGRPVGSPWVAGGGLVHMEFSPDSRYFITTNTDGTAQLWAAASGRPIGAPMRHDYTKTNDLLFGADTWVNHATFSPDSSLLVTCGCDQTARIWRSQTGRPLGHPLVHGDIVYRAVFSPDAQRVATACADGTVRLWDVATGRAIGALVEGEQPVLDMSFDSAGSLLATSENNYGGRVWDTINQQELFPPVTHTLSGSSPTVRFSPEGASVMFVGRAEAFDISPTNLPTADLLKLAQLRCGGRLDESGAVVALTKGEIESIWIELSGKYPHEFDVPEPVALNWRAGRDPSDFHRRWLARELIDADWHPGTRPAENQINSFLQKLYALAQFGRRDEAMSAADALAACSPKKADILYNCARVHALASGSARSDPGLADRYAGRAVALLRAALAAGYENTAQIQKDNDLKALRDRADFQKLLKERRPAHP